MATSTMLTAGALAVALATAACGTSESVTTSGGGDALPGDGPVDALVLIDRTAIAGGDRALAESYKAAALQTAATTIARGGKLSVRVFGRVGARSLLVYGTEVPSLEKVGAAARDDAGQTATLAAALDVAVGLAEPSKPAHVEALAGVTDDRGSDIARVLGQAIDTMGGSGGTSAVLVATDGWVEQPGERTLAQIIAADGPDAGAEALAKTARSQLSSGATVSLVRMTGLGSTAGRRGADANVVDDLREAWEGACNDLPVGKCVMQDAL